jgi:hypothetical protein
VRILKKAVMISFKVLEWLRKIKDRITGNQSRFEPFSSLFSSFVHMVMPTECQQFHAVVNVCCEICGDKILE